MFAKYNVVISNMHPYGERYNWIGWKQEKRVDHETLKELRVIDAADNQ